MKKIVLKHALLNAIQYGGKANFKAVIGKVLAERPDMRSKIKEISSLIKETIKEVNSMSLEEQERKLKELGIKRETTIPSDARIILQLPELPNKEKYKKIVMRMAPFPSGPLHIGNARMAILNDEYVKRNDGELILMMDDTIGSEEKILVEEGYDLIKDGLKWLNVKWHKIDHKSDRMKLFYEWAEKLIKINKAYVCKCPAKKLRSNRVKGIPCDCREQNVKKNLERWKKMLKGEYKEGEAVVRLKTDMKYPDPAFRDRVLLRISEREHPRVGRKYHVWPMLEYSWAIDDHFLGVTHILRGKDLVMEDMMEKFIWDSLKWKHPEIMHYGMLGIEGLKLSKSRARKLIQEGKYSGWDDPRTWSLQSLRKRGFKPKAIRNFILSFGMSMNDVTVPDDMLYSENRKLIEPVVNRYFCVMDPIEISVKGAPKVKEAKVNLHPDFPKRGKRRIPVNVDKILIQKEDFNEYKGEEVRLIGLFNVKLNERAQFTSEEIVAEMPKIQWVSEDNVPLKMIMDDGSVKEGLGEPEMKGLKPDESIQLMRIGFFRMDKTKPEIVLYFSHK